MLYRLFIDSSYSLEQAWNALENAGVEILYGSEEEGHIELFAHLFTLDSLSPFPWVVACEPYTLPPIDWQAQWATHGQNFQDGYIHIDPASLGRSGPILRLQPGSGFGDLSHPTTRLLINMLAQYMHDQVLVDIGCGSGILTLVAAAMGAPVAYGIDIDPQALEHSHQNALLNQLEEKCFFSTPDDFVWQALSKPTLIVMNMIRTEQLIAWSSLPGLHHQPAEILTSGIRAEERLSYLHQIVQWGWTLKEEKEEMGWLSFYFTNF